MTEGLEDDGLAELDWEGDQPRGCAVEGHGRNVLEMIDGHVSWVSFGGNE